MKKVIKLVIAYDGTNFYGWQRQTHQRSVQGVIEKTLSKLLKVPIEINGAGRTDAGVHAYGQAATFTAELPMSLEKFVEVINNYLPGDVAIVKASYEADDFHARYSATGKTYEYYVLHQKSPDVFKERTHYLYKYDLDEGLMKEVCQKLMGVHNFESFKASGSSAQNPYREITFLDFRREGRTLIFTFTGNGFLYKMVRILMGFILEIGNHHMDINVIDEVLNHPSRTYTSQIAPAKGLFLKEVYYS